MKKLKKALLIISSAIILSASGLCISASPDDLTGADESTKSTNLFTNSFDYNYDNTINWNKFRNDSIECFLTNEQTFQNKGYSVHVTNIQNPGEGVVSEIGHHVKPEIKYYNIKFYVFFESDQADRKASFSITVLDNRNSSEVIKKSFDIDANSWSPISCSFDLKDISEGSEINDNDFSVALSMDEPDETLSSFYFDSVSLNDITKSMESINERRKENEQIKTTIFDSPESIPVQSDEQIAKENTGQPAVLLVVIIITCLFLIFLAISVPLLIKKYNEDSTQKKK